MSASTITPEPRLWVSWIRSILGKLKNRRKIGSEDSGISMRRFDCPRVAILTTAGVVFSSIGARLGNGCPSTATGSADCKGVRTSSSNKNEMLFIRYLKGSWIEIKLFFHIVIKRLCLFVIGRRCLDHDFDELIPGLPARHSFTLEAHFLP